LSAFYSLPTRRSSDLDEVSIATAFLAGLVSFLSPCVLPLVPGYISIISGSSLDQLKAQEKDSALFRTVLMNSIMFIIGFSITFKIGRAHVLTPVTSGS